MSNTAKFGRYLLMAVLIGGFWYLNRTKPLWEEVVRTIAVFAIIMVVLRAVLHRKGVRVHLLPLLCGKAALILIAAGVEKLLRDHSVGHPSMIVAIGLGAAIFILGSSFDRHFFTLLPGGPHVPMGSDAGVGER